VAIPTGNVAVSETSPGIISFSIFSRIEDYPFQHIHRAASHKKPENQRSRILQQGAFTARMDTLVMAESNKEGTRAVV
jgi:hypothetical protein